MDKTCKNCQYFRKETLVTPVRPANVSDLVWLDMNKTFNYCSNSQSPLFRYVHTHSQTLVAGGMTCPEFTQRGKKAPAHLRFANFLLSLERDNPAKFWLLLGEVFLILFFIIFMVALWVLLNG